MRQSRYSPQQSAADFAWQVMDQSGVCSSNGKARGTLTGSTLRAGQAGVTEEHKV